MKDIDSSSFEFVPKAISSSESGFSAQPILPVTYQPVTTTPPMTRPAMKLSLFSQKLRLNTANPISTREMTNASVICKVASSMPVEPCSRCGRVWCVGNCMVTAGACRTLTRNTAKIPLSVTKAA